MLLLTVPDTQHCRLPLASEKRGLSAKMFEMVEPMFFVEPKY